MNTIDAIKSNLKYHDEPSCDAARASWFTVIAVLADAYADEGKTKEESICRWITGQRKGPNCIDKGLFFWAGSMGDISRDHMGFLPFSYFEMNELRLNDHGDLLECLDRLLAIPDAYLDRLLSCR